MAGKKAPQDPPECGSPALKNPNDEIQKSTPGSFEYHLHEISLCEKFALQDRFNFCNNR